MHGRSCTCLLAVSILILAPGFLRGQSGGVSRAPDLAAPLRPGLPPDLPSDPVQARASGPLRPVVPVTLPGFPPGSPSPGLPPGRSPVRHPVRFPVKVGLPLIAQAAGTIFSGTVTAIAPNPALSGQAIEIVAITFHVENAIRGATPGDDLQISQWIGLWSGGQRYRVGERVLLFLYPPSKLGLTSSVGGAMGRFAIDPAGGVLLSAQHVSAFRTDPVLGGKSRVRFSDFALAVRQASKEE
jgi:hypothetical protein